MCVKRGILKENNCLYSQGKYVECQQYIIFQILLISLKE